jgi:hypothetical protein
MLLKRVGCHLDMTSPALGTASRTVETGPILESIPATETAVRGNYKTEVNRDSRPADMDKVFIHLFLTDRQNLRNLHCIHLLLRQQLKEFLSDRQHLGALSCRNNGRVAFYLAAEFPS